MRLLERAAVFKWFSIVRPRNWFGASTRPTSTTGASAATEMRQRGDGAERSASAREPMDRRSIWGLCACAPPSHKTTYVGSQSIYKTSGVARHIRFHVSTNLYTFFCMCIYVYLHIQIYLYPIFDAEAQRTSTNPQTTWLISRRRG